MSLFITIVLGVFGGLLLLRFVDRAVASFYEEWTAKDIFVWVVFLGLVAAGLVDISRSIIR